jgi:hypothetical protein
VLATRERGGELALQRGDIVFLIVERDHDRKHRRENGGTRARLEVGTRYSGGCDNRSRQRPRHCRSGRPRRI